MAQQTGNSFLGTAVMAGAFGVVAFGLAVAIGKYDLMPSAFIGGVIALLTGIVFFVAFTGGSDRMPVPRHDDRPAVAAPPPAAPPAAAPKAPPAAAAAAPAAAPTRPLSLTEPRGGKADDLKVIVGIGPKLEQLCHRLGYFHFDQIAAWTPAEVAWVDENLEGFRGRVTRDRWVEQARRLVAEAKG
ncbi:MAG: NADH:ubiquinone oxidoreductase [Rhodobacteraceae bacterium]|nr:NADH:ubiquinone oxidoreductase [Paracoccaceae bacterium]